MGKMKEIFTQQMEDEITGMSDAEYQNMINSAAFDSYTDTDENGEPCCGGDCHCEGEPATQEDKESEHDAWWNSLTEKQKQQLYNDQEESFKLSIDEMNHDLGFGK